MSDSNATDELRRMLDERGVEWKDGDAAYEIEWSTPDGRRCSAMYWKPTFSVLISGCTPEQAIAATLGGGKLTAEQVREATYAHSIHADCADADWQAIADELNAALGSDDKSRWAELFGTPERAARTLASMCDGMEFCSHCPLWKAGINHCEGELHGAGMLEWLRGDAE